ncbi:MAG TPA: hypothetical protein PK359_14215 [Burkholderiaceae bacterium]|nr:hypothetical protein [Burkholderiaceae bacterium]
MNELILLCAGAAADTDPDARGGMDPPRSAGLDAWLARGGVIRDDSLSGTPLAELPEDDFLRRLFGVPAGVSVEALAGAACGLAMPYWRVTPCHLHLGMDHAMLTDPPQLQLTPAEAQALCATVAPSFAERGLTLVTPTAHTWFVQGGPWALQTHAWTQASGRNIAAYQPTGAQARDWRRLLTEVQMLWHEHPVNQARATRGLRAVNALWLDGFATAAPPRGTGTVFADSPVLTGLAAAAGWTIQPLADFHDALPDMPGSSSPDRSPRGAERDPNVANPAPILVDLDHWRASRRLGDLSGWQLAWSQFDNWLAAHSTALTQAARRGPVRVVLTGERRILELSARQPAGWRFWRRFDAHAAIAAGAAGKRRPAGTR